MDNGENGLTAFELEREAIIARNRQRLEEVGVFEAAQRLDEVVSILPKTKTKNEKRKKRGRKHENGEFRRQTRSQTAAKLRKTRSQNAETKLVEFIVTGVCPKCKKVFSKNHRKHIIACQGVLHERASRSPIPLAIESVPEEMEKLRIQEVTVSKLIAKTDESVKFAVIGSTGYSYAVTLSDEKQTCQCLDHRMRRRACKHIKALLEKLDILDDPHKWRNVT